MSSKATKSKRLILKYIISKLSNKNNVQSICIISSKMLFFCFGLNSPVIVNL